MYQKAVEIILFVFGLTSVSEMSYIITTEIKLSGGREVRGVMLNITNMNHFYYVRDFTNMRCKHSPVLSIIRKRLHKDQVMEMFLLSCRAIEE